MSINRNNCLSPSPLPEHKENYRFDNVMSFKAMAVAKRSHHKQDAKSPHPSNSFATIYSHSQVAKKLPFEEETQTSRDYLSRKG
jgi:hypothetical protein